MRSLNTRRVLPFFLVFDEDLIAGFHLVEFVEDVGHPGPREAEGVPRDKRVRARYPGQSAAAQARMPSLSRSACLEPVGTATSFRPSLGTVIFMAADAFSPPEVTRGAFSGTSSRKSSPPSSVPVFSTSAVRSFAEAVSAYSGRMGRPGGKARPPARRARPKLSVLSPAGSIPSEH